MKRANPWTQEITVELVAFMVECPVCGAGEISLDDVDGCWDDEGRENVPTHSERLERAREAVRQAIAMREAVSDV